MRSVSLLVTGVLLALCASAQVFEVASIKLSATGAGGGLTNMIDRTLTVRNVTLRGCIANAYQIKGGDVDGPAWLDSDRFDIVAKAPADSLHPDLPKMYQALLAERFKLKAHVETKEMPGYALRVVRGGVKFEDIGPKPRAGRTMTGAVQTGSMVSTAGTTMASFARVLENGFRMPVVDETGTSNYFLVKLEFSPVDIDVESGGGLKPSLMTALREQAGLQLEKAKVSVKHVIVDSVEKKPTEN